MTQYVLTVDLPSTFELGSLDQGPRTVVPEVFTPSGGGNPPTVVSENEVVCPSDEPTVVYDVAHTPQTTRIMVQYFVGGGAEWGGPLPPEGSGNIETKVVIDGVLAPLDTQQEFLVVYAPKQTLFWSADSGGSAGDFFSAMNGRSQSGGTAGSELNSFVAVPAPKRVRRLRVDTAGGGNVDADVTIQVHVDGGPTAVTCTIPTGSNAAVDNLHDLSLSAGQQLSIEITSATGGGQALLASLEMADLQAASDGSFLTTGAFGVFTVTAGDEHDVQVYVTFSSPDGGDSTWTASGYCMVSDVAT